MCRVKTGKIWRKRMLVVRQNSTRAQTELISVGVGVFVTTDGRKPDANRVANKKQARHRRTASLTRTKNVQFNGSGGEIVAMMQTTEPQHGDNIAVRARVFRCRSLLAHPKMRSVLVVQAINTTPILLNSD
jgi:hypothetical protein